MTRTPRVSPRAVAVIGAAAASLVLVSAAIGHYNRPNYTYGSSSCENASDPVNVVFYGTAAANHRAYDHVRRHTGWDRYNGNDQWIRNHGECERMYDQLASGRFSRFHARFFGNGHKDDKGRWETSTGAHHEDWVWTCPGHAVDKGTVDEPTDNGSGFDQGRRELAQQMYDAKHHPIYYERGRNTRSFKQCDGDKAGSDGLIAWILVGRRYPK